MLGVTLQVVQSEAKLAAPAGLPRMFSHFKGVLMPRLIKQLAYYARVLLIARAGRHRAEPPPLPRSARPLRPAPRRTPVAPSVRPWYEPIDGTSTPLVRPYLTAYEREEKARIQRLRRDILWCATYGVDLDTRDIHACLGAAS
ncbi:hypothetical protein [Streptomyces sp. NPDC002671]